MHPHVGPWLWTIFLTLGEGMIAYLTATEAGIPIGWAIVGFVVVAGVTFAIIMPTRDRSDSSRQAPSADLADDEGGTRA